MTQNISLPPDKTINLMFADAETANYVRLMMTRKGVTTEDYILGNLEWDDKPDCLAPEILKKIPKGLCRGCEWHDKCPDSEKAWGRS